MLDYSALASELSFHHIGVATRSIEKEVLYYRALGYTPDGPLFIDEKQGVKGVFLSSASGPRLELLENLHDTGPLDDYLHRGVKFYHMAYSSPDIEASLHHILSLSGGKTIVPVTSATCFSKLCFVMLPNMMLLELVENTL